MKNKTSIALTLGIAFFVGASLFGIFLGQNNRRSTLILDPLSDIQVEFIGENGKGHAVITPPVIPYGGDDEAVLRLIEGIHYTVDPNSHLTNGQTVTVKIVANENVKQLANVEWKNETRKLQVKDLVSDQKEIITRPSNSSESKDNSESTALDDIHDTKEYMVVEGIEIPISWNLSDEEIQAYVNYMHSADDSQAPADKTQDEWIQGNSDTKTNRQNAKYYTKDYLENLNTTYKQAYAFGIESSQRFKIVPIVEDNNTVGYECIFEE